MIDPYIEMGTWYEFICQEENLQLEKDRLLAMPTPIPSERESQKRQLKELDVELGALRQEMDRYVASTNTQPKAKITASTTPPPWIAEAKKIARALLTSNPKLRNRSILIIASKVREEMINQRLTGRGGQTPSVDTIKRHALSGIKKQGIALKP